MAPARAETLRLQLAHLHSVYRSRPALVDATGFRPGDPLKLALASQVRFELGEHASMSRKHLPARRAGVDRLLGRFHRSAPRPHRANDVLQVADRAGEPVGPGDYEHVGFAEEIQNSPQFLVALEAEGYMDGLFGLNDFESSPPNLGKDEMFGNNLLSVMKNHQNSKCCRDARYV
jgi:hypothetical protein